MLKPKTLDVLTRRIGGLSYEAKYLGLHLGPEACNTSWMGLTTRYQGEAEAWVEQNEGLLFTAPTYNTFALPVLTYVAQLTKSPAVTLEAEQRMLHQAVPEPLSWCVTQTRRG